MVEPTRDGAAGDAAPTPESEAAARRGPKRAGRIGRRIALAVWAVGMLYIVVVGFVTVIPQVFLQEPPADPSGRLFDGDCDSTATALSEGLLERAGEQVAEARPAATLTPYFRRWDQRFLAYRNHCGETRRSRELARLRYRLETTLRRFDREEGAIVRRMDQLDSD